MKTYEKPGIGFVELLQDERISAACPVRWIWDPQSGPNQDEISEYYRIYFGHDMMPFGWECAFNVEVNLGHS